MDCPRVQEGPRTGEQALRLYERLRGFLRVVRNQHHAHRLPHPRYAGEEEYAVGSCSDWPRHVHVPHREPYALRWGGKGAIPTFQEFVQGYGIELVPEQAVTAKLKERD